VKAGLFEDLPQPSEPQVQQAQAKAASKRLYRLAIETC
jgi:hypothetical protein